VGLATRHLLVRDTPAPDAIAILPLAVLGLLGTVVSVSSYWRTWPRWGKVITIVIIFGWVQAAVRG
jgi:hypothetical protein